MKEKYILSGLLILVIATLIYSSYGFFTNPADLADSNNKLTGSSFKTISSGSTDSGDVSIELTPQNIENRKLNVEIAANTHSVDLSQFDLKKITTLEHNGKIIKPISAPVLNGHHSSGMVVFDVEEEINSFTIKIKGIPKIEERIFKW